MKSYVTSYNGLFARRVGDAPEVQRIEIPIIQRDYAQGRDGGNVARIRANFLDALHNALTTATPISLDFVYGDVVEGTLRPLDGQQRLTTLFLLHWYLAWRAGRLEQEKHHVGTLAAHVKGFEDKRTSLALTLGTARSRDW